MGNQMRKFEFKKFFDRDDYLADSGLANFVSPDDSKAWPLTSFRKKNGELNNARRFGTNNVNQTADAALANAPLSFPPGEERIDLGSVAPLVFGAQEQRPVPNLQ